MNTSPLEDIYSSHHSKRRGEGFVLLGDSRGRFLIERIGQNKTVLDIGCRDGALTSYFAKGNTVLGVDIDSASLNRAKETLGIETRQVDLNGEWNLFTEKYDVVVAAEVVEHLYYPEKVFKKVTAVLKPGGIFLGTVPNAFSLAHRARYLFKQKRNTPLMDPTHINHFVVEELKALLEEDFVDVRIHGLGRLGVLAQLFPQAFAYDLAFEATKRIP
jgi:2-polyprenyl-3-methyl-5-hydroxy-6-metoxy-1,4-benzoquinol methylase